MDEQILREVEQQLRNALRIYAEERRPKTERESISMFLGMIEMRIKDGDVDAFDLSWKKGSGQIVVDGHTVSLDIELSTH